MGEHGRVAFEAFAQQKVDEASAARIQTLTSLFDRSDETATQRIGNEWSRQHYGGDFGLAIAPPDRTAISLVFVQSLDRNTAAADPGTLGGGATDKHLIYEGLSRTAADAVLLGARTVYPAAFFSVWHPALVALRESLGLPRHPVQIVISNQGHVDFTWLLFNVPDVPVFVIAGAESLRRQASALRDRPWIRVLPLTDEGVRPAIDCLRLEHGIRRISAVGGRLTATRLVDGGLAQDIYLTTGPRAGGVPGTPWYAGAEPPSLDVTTRKEWVDGGAGIVFEHIMIGS